MFASAAVLQQRTGSWLQGGQSSSSCRKESPARKVQVKQRQQNQMPVHRVKYSIKMALQLSKWESPTIYLKKNAVSKLTNELLAQITTQ